MHQFRVILFLDVLFSPLGKLGKHWQQGLSLFRQGVFHMGRDLVELLPVDDAQLLQVLQSGGEHCIGDSGDGFFQFSEAAGM